MSRPRGLPAWAVRPGPFGIRLVDLLITHLVIVAMELNVIVGTGPGVTPLDWTARILGGALALPVLFRRRWPFQVLLACSILLMLYYFLHRRDISPAPLLAVPLYDAAAAGYLWWAIAIPAFYMSIGLVLVAASTREGMATLATSFLPSIAMLALAVALGDVVRSRRALAAETATRLRLAAEERAAEAARLVAEERLRIARELHDTVAHSMATIAVQAGSALHVLDGVGGFGGVGGVDGFGASGGSSGAGAAERLRSALTAIRSTSKSALGEMRTVLGQLRRADPARPPDALTGLARLPALRDAVAAAGTAVTITVEGKEAALHAEADHAAYRILQESLTNVLRHAGPGASAAVLLRYSPGTLTLTITDSGDGGASGDDVDSGDDGDSGDSGADGSSGHGIGGMRERAEAAGGTLVAGPQAGGGFRVMAMLPTETVGEPA